MFIPDPTARALRAFEDKARNAAFNANDMPASPALAIRALSLMDGMVASRVQDALRAVTAAGWTLGTSFYTGPDGMRVVVTVAAPTERRPDPTLARQLRGARFARLTNHTWRVEAARRP